MLKRLTDLVISIVLLVLFSPLMIGLAILVAISSPGGALFRQQRVGRDGRPFQLLKFRSMRVLSGTEAGSFDAGDARRVTGVGRFLRKTKLDELPQLINVLRGDMSLVGPRPEVEKWTRVYPERWRTVLRVRPGITDEASIRYRNEEEILAASDDPEELYRNRILPRKLDLAEHYATAHSLPGDLRIMLATVAAVVLPQRSTGTRDEDRG